MSGSLRAKTIERLAEHSLKVSIVTVVFNNCDTIEAAIKSVLAQNHRDIELIVIDGGSTDGTREVLAQYESSIAILVSEPDDGIYHALNKGIDLASGEAIGFLHSDDLFADSFAVERVVHALADPTVDAAYGDLVYVRKLDPTCVVRHWRAGTYRPELLRRGWMPPHPTFYARRELYQRHGGFEVSLRIAGDYDCMLRFLVAGAKLAYIPQVQVRMRLGGASNRSLRNIITKSYEDYRALRRHGVGGVGAVLWKNLSKLPQFLSARRLPKLA